MRVATALFLLVCGSSHAAVLGSDNQTVELAEHSFLLGAHTRHDAVKSRWAFGVSAQRFDSAWQTRANRTPTLALNRGRAHYLAGNLPQAIRAFRDGLDLYPWDAELQRGLALCRAAVAYPTEAEPAERVRPDPPSGLRNRVSPLDLFAASAVGSLLLVVGLARRFTARDGWAVPVAVVGGVVLLLVAGAWWQTDRERRRDRDTPVAVLSADTVLRTGNGPSFPARLEAALPRGAEVRELGRRGGWVQVQLPGGAVGWVPESAVLSADPTG
jgi:hypothetical protein